MICGRPRTGLALLDLSVVFDTTNHGILLDWPLGSPLFFSFFYGKFHSVGLGARGSCNKGCLRASVFCPFCLTLKCWERSFNSSSISMLQCNLVTLQVFCTCILIATSDSLLKLTLASFQTNVNPSLH